MKGTISSMFPTLSFGERHAHDATYKRSSGFTQTSLSFLNFTYCTFRLQTLSHVFFDRTITRLIITNGRYNSYTSCNLYHSSVRLCKSVKNYNSYVCFDKILFNVVKYV